MFNRTNIFRCLIAVVTVMGAHNALSVQAPNPRGASMTATNSRGTDSVTASRATTNRTVARTADARASARGAVVSNALRGGATVGRSATTVRSTNARGATNNTAARSAVKPNTARASVARATAVFNDISKIGGGYAACRESYATCMDQFCANANDTYRRCYCSSRYAEFRNTEDALDQAQTLLMRFEDNNLNAVDKTAAEVGAMYSATVGESAIKNDTSAAAKMLDEIGDLLSGKKKTYTANTASTSLGILSLDFSGDINDIWSDGGSSIFSNGGGQNLSDLDGVELYNAANKQCMSIVADSCESSAVSNMARSSYSIMITQDCNAYQKNIDKRVEAVKQTVRTAEKYLREARLEEYRSHNSADVNECISRVRTALTADTACGANYKRCMDYTGAYINQTTGEPIYSPRLFQLTNIITLPGYTNSGANIDVLGANPEFNKFLESKKIFATAALDTCRDIATTVWNEFKRTALIEIAQAQDEKIEEVKMSCVSTMADCYDTQTSALRDFDKTTAQMSGALSAYAAKKMCVDKVSACAALYGNDTPCDFGNDGKLSNASACGLTALLDFVTTVDTIRIAEGCETALQNYATELCTPSSGTMGYPWNCRLKTKKEISGNINKMAETYCNTDLVNYENNEVKNIVDRITDDIASELNSMLSEQCDELGGTWVNKAEYSNLMGKYEKLRAYYSSVYGGNETNEYGYCMESTTRLLCEAYNIDSTSPVATYNATTDTCVFSAAWYEQKCTNELGGIWDNNTCYMMQ